MEQLIDNEVLETTEVTKKRVYEARFFKVAIREDKIPEFVQLNRAGKLFFLASKMRMISRKTLEEQGISEVPAGAWDADRELLAAAIQ